MLMDIKVVMEGIWGDWYHRPLNLRVVPLRNIPTWIEDVDWEVDLQVFAGQETPEAWCNPTENELGNSELFEINISMTWQEGASKQNLILGIGEYRKLHLFPIVNG